MVVCAAEQYQLQRKHQLQAFIRKFLAHDIRTNENVPASHATSVCG